MCSLVVHAPAPLMNEGLACLCVQVYWLLHKKNDTCPSITIADGEVSTNGC